jgi:membrane associated rhomboid family serine protease
MTQDMNGQGHDDGGKGDDGNVIRIPTLAERGRLRREKERLERKIKSAAEPMINLPPATKYLLGLILGVFLVTGVALSEQMSSRIIETFGFIPARFNGGAFDLFAALSPLTHMALHGGWLHIIMNAFMLAAFGSGVERWIGARKMLLICLISGFCGAAFHYLLNSNSPAPMIGASGALSGLFAAALVMLGRGQREMGGKYGMLPFAILWIGLSIGFGMMGGPDGSLIAWAAHVGGFLGGFLAVKILRI